MKRLVVITALVVGALGLWARPVRAQWVVFDPRNYLEAIAEVQALIKQYTLLTEEAKRLPVNMAGRYHVYTPGWAPHDLGAVSYAGQLLHALNDGDASGAGYRSMAAALDDFPGVVGRMPEALRGPLATDYANVELADAVATSGIDQVGVMRETNNLDLQVIQQMEADAFSGADTYQTQKAILNKINAANVVALKLAVQNHEFLGDTLEQLIVQNKRQRDAEARLMNATVAQWRYGQAYGADFYSHTAADVDGWQPF